MELHLTYMGEIPLVSYEYNLLLTHPDQEKKGWKLSSTGFNNLIIFKIFHLGVGPQHNSHISAGNHCLTVLT